MPKVFVDTVAWIALVNTRDSLHNTAKQVLSDLQEAKYQFVTSEFVLLEFANALSSPDFRQKASLFVRGLQEMSDVEVVEASHELFSQGLELYEKRLDKEWSLVDCSSFVLMSENNVSEAFTADHHFEQAGFVNLL